MRPPLYRSLRTFCQSTLNKSPLSCVNPSRTAFYSAMKYNKLGCSDLLVSEVCLGTMTWGVQNTENDAHAQLDMAIAAGVNFIDTAELYPVPTSAPGHEPGRSERYIGTYINSHPGIREQLIIATKVIGFSRNSVTAANRHSERDYGDKFPDGRLDRTSILEACDASLKRLQTHYVDLYQLHWPDRYAPMFGARAYDLKRERDAVPIRETLLALKDLIDSGKIRAYGLSNESTFGVCEFVRLADEIGMPRPASIQNSFCLLNRAFEFELAEACSPRNFNIGLLPWSILAGGVLTGKYNGKLNATFDPVDDSLNDARFVKFKFFQGRFVSQETLKITHQYAEIAKGAGMSVATLAQAFCKSRWYIPSSIIGATTSEQLKENLAAFDVELSDKVLQQIDRVHNSNKDPVVQV